MQTDTQTLTTIRIFEHELAITEKLLTELWNADLDTFDFTAWQEANRRNILTAMIAARVGIREG